MVSNIDDNRVWQLELGGEVVATFSEFRYEFPWHHAGIVNSPKFDRFRDFFLENDDRPWDSQEFEDLYDEISSKGDFILRYMNRNITYNYVILHYEGDYVWFRCCEMKSE
jgi:hypothetical protein